MRPNFEFYLASLDRWPLDVGVDLSLRPHVPFRDLPYRVHVRLDLNHPTLDGLATMEEEALLLAIEERILQRLPKDDAIFVAQVTHRAARTLVIYMRHKPEGNHLIFEILSAVNTHKLTVSFEVDENWMEYTEILYPNEVCQHQIRDRHLLKEFERRGDDPSQVHTIEPAFMSRSVEDAKKLQAELKGAGFGVKEVQELGSNGSRTFRVVGKVDSPLGMAILDDFRQAWIDLAKRAGCRYEGWASEVIPCGRPDNSSDGTKKRA